MIEKISTYLKSEAMGWKPLDIAWLVIASTVILGVSLYWKDSIIAIMAALTGAWCVILTGKGKRSSFIWGAFNVVFYAIIAFGAKYYGEVMLNLIYYFPMNFVGWIVWKRHMNEETGEVIKQKLLTKKAVFIYGITAIAIVAYGFVLKSLGGNLPFVDSISTIISITAQILSIRRLKEQWVLWIVVDIVTILKWAINFAQGGENIAALLMWSVYLLNAIFMYDRWNREAK